MGLKTLLACSIAFAAPLLSAPWNGGRNGDSEGLKTQGSISALRHQLGNQEAEIRAFEQKLESLQTILESLQEQLQETAKAQKEQLKGSANSLEMKMAALESTLKSAGADIKQLQAHANDTSALLQELKQKLPDGTVQNKKIENLQAALSNLMDALQVKMEIQPPLVENGRTYKVKSGDSLAKIAKAHGTTVKAMMELNGMNTDKIVVGKILKLP